MNTRNLAGFASLLAVVLPLNPAFADVFTPVIASTISPEAHPIRGTDGAYHVIYELLLTNTKSLPATIRSIDVLAGASRSEVITSFSGADLLSRLRTLAPEPAKDAIIEPNQLGCSTLNSRSATQPIFPRCSNIGCISSSLPTRALQNRNLLST